MKAGVRLAAVCLAAAAVCLAAIDGTVTNSTSGNPQGAVIITLVQPGAGGMQTLATVRSDASGRFHIDKQGQGEGPLLLQAIYQGVLYTQMLPPGSPTGNVQLAVFDSSSKSETAQLETHMVLLQPTGSELAVGETFLFRNDSKLTYNDSTNGTVHVYLPDGIAPDKVAVTISTAQGMPIQRGVEKTKQKNVYKVDYPVKPGETRFDIAYSLPAANPQTFAGKIVQTGGPTRLVVPRGVTLTGDNLTSLGPEPTTQANIYEVKGDSYKVNIQGTGSIQSNQSGSDDDSGPGIQEILPKLYDRLYWVLGLSLTILALGFVLLYRKDGSAEPTAAPVPAKGKKKA